MHAVNADFSRKVLVLSSACGQVSASDVFSVLVVDMSLDCCGKRGEHGLIPRSSARRATSCDDANHQYTGVGVNHMCVCLPTMKMFRAEPCPDVPDQTLSIFSSFVASDSPADWHVPNDRDKKSCRSFRMSHSPELTPCAFLTLVPRLAQAGWGAGIACWSGTQTNCRLQSSLK